MMHQARGQTYIVCVDLLKLHQANNETILSAQIDKSNIAVVGMKLAKLAFLNNLSSKDWMYYHAG
jgi:hypothetical protein